MWQKKHGNIKKIWQWGHVRKMERFCQLFWLMVELDQTKKRILDVLSIKLTFSLTVVTLPKLQTELENL